MGPNGGSVATDLEHFQSFIVVLKSGIFTNYFAETASYVCRSVNKLNQTNSGKDVSRGRDIKKRPKSEGKKLQLAWVL
jgi:hypothetical protein